MNENIDLTQILKGCPKGTELYSTIYGEVRFEGINNNDTLYPIELKAHKFTTQSASVYCTKDGRFNCAYDGECTLFPAKDQRDWSKFERFWDKPRVEKFDPKTLQPFDKVLIRCDNFGKWNIDLFGYFDNPYKGVCCLDSCLQMCIPYNDETKHLVGTKKDCPEYYKWWEE